MRQILWITFQLACVGLALSPASTQAADDNYKNALNNVQAEMTTCLAYYLISRQCIINRGKADDKPAIEKTDNVIRHLLSLSSSLADSIGMTTDAAISRLQNERESMVSLIKSDCINIASLARRHAYRCKQVVENGDSVLQEYLDKN